TNPSRECVSVQRGVNVDDAAYRVLRRVDHRPDGRARVTDDYRPFHARRDDRDVKLLDRAVEAAEGAEAFALARHVEHERCSSGINSPQRPDNRPPHRSVEGESRQEDEWRTAIRRTGIEVPCEFAEARRRPCVGRGAHSCPFGMLYRYSVT